MIYSVFRLSLCRWVPWNTAAPTEVRLKTEHQTPKLVHHLVYNTQPQVKPKLRVSRACGLSREMRYIAQTPDKTHGDTITAVLTVKLLSPGDDRSSVVYTVHIRQ